MANGRPEGPKEPAPGSEAAQMVDSRAARGGVRRVSARRKPSSRRVSERHWTKLIEEVIEFLGMVVHGLTGAVAHVIAKISRALPDTPTGLLGMIVLLSFVLVAVKEWEPRSENLCFGCLATFAVFGLGLIFVILKSQGTNDRLRDMQQNRLQAIRVDPITVEPPHMAYEDSRN
jgi:hypothetical protein